jgi:ubiquinone/menaquinone biosynthesis C-methylase UbiE
MTAHAIDFDDSAAYERAMGRWSRAVARVFLEWLAPPENARWLDVGCGTGILSHVLLELCAPAAVVGVDSAAPQVEQALRGPAAGRASFEMADACALPFPDTSFDIVASALVLNFIAEQRRALAEMRRVVRAGGAVAAYVWDFAEELSPSGPLRRGMRRLGRPAPPIPGTAESGLEALEGLFREAGLGRIETRTFDVCLAYESFEDFWQAQTPGYTPTTKVIAAMSEGDRTRLKRVVRDQLPAAPGGVIEYFARANAVKARAP